MKEQNTDWNVHRIPVRVNIQDPDIVKLAPEPGINLDRFFHPVGG
jgi:hypothetical protein